MCGSSDQASTTSGPAPTLAAAAVCGRRSSQPAKSTCTGTPVCLGELLGVLAEHPLVAVDELGRPQHAQAGAVLDRQVGRRDVGDRILLLLGQRRVAPAEQGSAGNEAGAELDEITAREMLHRQLPFSCGGSRSEVAPGPALPKSDGRHPASRQGRRRGGPLAPSLRHPGDARRCGSRCAGDLFKGSGFRPGLPRQYDTPVPMTRGRAGCRAPLDDPRLGAGLEQAARRRRPRFRALPDGPACRASPRVGWRICR